MCILFIFKTLDCKKQKIPVSWYELQIYELFPKKRFFYFTPQNPQIGFLFQNVLRTLMCEAHLTYYQFSIFMKSKLSGFSTYFLAAS